MLTHGHCTNKRKSPTYISWQSMIARCLHESHPYYDDYGGRGIQVCGRWLGPGGFLRFLEDLGESPPGMTLDRTDVHADYTPDNCRWATKREQRWNRLDMAMRMQQRMLWDEDAPPPSTGEDDLHECKDEVPF